MAEILPNIRSPQDLQGLSLEELNRLAGEIRREIVQTVSRVGGHFSPNLGVVELTIALHAMYDFSRDRLVWDVSHQSYPHKLLTGRYDRFDTIKQKGGLSGFCNRQESVYDTYTFGHTSTSISTALGIVCADEKAGVKRDVVAVIGDGALTGGIAYEALHHAGSLQKKMLVVLNDNAMSISRTVGALSEYLGRIRTNPFYREIKREIADFIEKTPLGHPLEKMWEKFGHSVMSWVGGPIFEEFGFHYYGPVDGHDIEGLQKGLKRVRRLNKPVLLHIVTEKGKGYHSITGKKDADAPYSVSPPKDPNAPPSGPSYTSIFSGKLRELARGDKRITAITAAMPAGTGLDQFEKEFPGRYYDVAICEQHAVAFASGLATGGAVPVVVLYSTFLQRAFDQVFQEVSLQPVPVVIGIDRAGLVGGDGPTHHGVFDIAYLRVFPNLVLMAPRDKTELEEMLSMAVSSDLPCAIRYPKGSAPDESLFPKERAPLSLGKAETLREGEDGCVVAYGATVVEAVKAAETLSKEGIEIAVVNGRFAKPVDADLFADLSKRMPFVVTVEDHALAGGFGSAVLEAVEGKQGNTAAVTRLGIPDRFIEHADRKQQLADLGLDAAGIVATVRKLASTRLLSKKLHPRF